MNTAKPKTAIRIIKRDERERREQATEPQATKKTAQETARDMVSTVTGWVGELQHRHRTETARAIKTLFPEVNPQAN